MEREEQRALAEGFWRVDVRELGLEGVVVHERRVAHDLWRGDGRVSTPRCRERLAWLLSVAGSTAVRMAVEHVAVAWWLSVAVKRGCLEADACGG